MIDIEYLRKNFCATPDDPRFYLHEPFNLDGHTICTDGAVFVRVGLDVKFTACANEKPVPIIRRLYSALVIDESIFTAIPTLPIRHKICKYCDREGCETCNNLGYFLDQRRVKCGAAEISNEYANKIATLFKCQIILPIENDKPIYFRFDGGDGFLMPMIPFIDTFANKRR